MRRTLTRQKNRRSAPPALARACVGLCATFVVGAAAAASGQTVGAAASLPRATTTVVGIVGDSLHGGPLAGAVIMLDGQSREAVTDSIGRFRIDSVAAGRYRMGIFHPILDSLGTSLASRPVRFVAGRPLLISMATPSGRTIRRAVCPEQSATHHAPIEHADSGAAVVVGRVLDAESQVPVVGADVTLSWIETAFSRTAIRVSHYRRATTTDIGGEFHLCALPSGLTGVLRATVGADTARSVERDVGLDNRIITMATLHLATADSAHPAVPAAHAVVTGSVERPDGSPFAGATAIVEGTPDSAVTGRDGTFTIRHLPSGTHTILVRSLGFEPVEDVVELTARAPQRVVIALTTPAEVLSPILVEAQRLQEGYKRVGFDRRREEGVGQFMTADEIAARHARLFSELFTMTTGVERSYTPGGTNLLSSRGPGSCLVYVLDGQPFNRRIDGELDVLYQPDEIAGIEVYSAASVPPEFRVRSLPGPNAAGAPTMGANGCTTIVVWTKTDLGVEH